MTLLIKMIPQLMCVLCFLVFPLQAYQYDLSICAIFQNEARFLKEWIEFHKLLGVQHFYLYNNLSEDRYKKVLKPYILSGLVELIEFPYESSNQIEFNSIQINAYEHALALSRGASRWVAFIDADEFLFPLEGNSIVEFLKDYEDYGAVEVNWQVFGTSNVKKVPKKKLMIEVLIMKGDENLEMNQNTKSIVQPHLTEKCLGAHNFSFIDSYFGVYTNYAHSKPNPKSSYILIDKIRINHYWTRDEKFAKKVKLPRYELWHHRLKYYNIIKPKLNAVEDKTIQRFVPLLRKAMKMPYSLKQLAKKDK